MVCEQLGLCSCAYVCLYLVGDVVVKVSPPVLPLLLGSILRISSQLRE